MTRNQQIRSEILTLTYAARPLAMSAEAMARRTRQFGNDFTTVEMARESAFLAGQKLIESQLDISTGESRYSITSAGVVEYERTA